MNFIPRPLVQPGPTSKQIGRAKHSDNGYATIADQRDKSLEEIARLTAKFEACDQARKNACDDRDTARAELAKANAELERLSWRSVEVTPTEQDADANGQITTLGKDGRLHLWSWYAPFEGNTIMWRSTCAPAPSAEEVSRAEMEADYQKALKQTWMDVSQSLSREAFEWGWKLARASKEVKA